MKVSVIIVSYNCKAFLDYCIQSVIKALNNSSVSFIESNKGFVIQSAITEVMNVVGFVKSQLKTIIIDIKERF